MCWVWLCCWRCHCSTDTWHRACTCRFRDFRAPCNCQGMFWQSLIARIRIFQCYGWAFLRPKMNESSLGLQYGCLCLCGPLVWEPKSLYSSLLPYPLGIRREWELDAGRKFLKSCNWRYRWSYIDQPTGNRWWNLPRGRRRRHPYWSFCLNQRNLSFVFGLGSKTPKRLHRSHWLFLSIPCGPRDFWVWAFFAGFHKHQAK